MYKIQEVVHKFRSGSTSSGSPEKNKERGEDGGSGGAGSVGLSSQATGLMSTLTSLGAGNAASGEVAGGRQCSKWYGMDDVDPSDPSLLTTGLPLSGEGGAELSSLPLMTPAGLHQTSLTSWGQPRPLADPATPPVTPPINAAGVIAKEGTPTSSATASPEKKLGRTRPKGTLEYKVGKEDTLEKIAAHFDVTPSELKKLNRLSFHMVFENQVLYIPDPNYASSGTVTPEPHSPAPNSPLNAKPRVDIPVVKMTEKPTTTTTTTNTINTTTTTSSTKPSSALSLLPAPDYQENLPPPPASAPPVPTNRPTPFLSRTFSDGGGGEVIQAARGEKKDQEGEGGGVERFLKLSAQMISEGFEKVPGTLLVTPNAIMFEPDLMDDRVVEEGAEHYGAVVYMDTLLSAAIYHDLSALRFHTRCGSESELLEKPEVYHGEGRARSASASGILEDKPSHSLGSLLQSASKSVSTLFLKSPAPQKTDSADVTIFPLPPAQDNDDSKSREDDGRRRSSKAEAEREASSSSTTAHDNKMTVFSNSTNKSVGGASVADSSSSNAGGATTTPSDQDPVFKRQQGGEGGGERGGVGGRQPRPPPPSLLVQQPSQSEAPCDGRTEEEEEGSSLAWDMVGDATVSSNDVGKSYSVSTSSQTPGSDDDDRSARAGGGRCATSEEDGGAGERAEEGGGSGKEDGGGGGGGGKEMRIGSIVYLPVEETSEGRMVVVRTDKTTTTTTTAAATATMVTATTTTTKTVPEPSHRDDDNHSQDRSGGRETAPGGKHRPPPLSIPPTTTDGVTSHSTVGDVRSRGLSESFSPLRSSAQQLSSFVSYAAGFFRGSQDDRADVRDIQDMTLTPDSATVDSHDGSGARTLPSPECRFLSAVKAEERPELFKKISDLLPHHEDIHKQPALYFHLRVDTEACDKQVAASTPCESHRHQTTKPHYWFSVPRNKGDHLYAFFVHWRPDLYGDDDINPEDRGFVVVDRVDVSENEGSLPFLDDHFGQQLSSSFKKDWEWFPVQIVSREELRRRASLILDLDHNIMPEMSEGSSIMSDEDITELSGKLPPRTVGYRWSLEYSTGIHGFSLRRLYRELGQVDSPILLVLQDTEGVVFGAYLSDPPRLSDHFYGTGTCQLWTFKDKLQVFGWTGDNPYFIKGDDSSLSVGASHGSYGLWVDSDLYHGHSQECSTFDNCVLSGSADFFIKGLEAWSFLSG